MMAEGVQHSCDAGDTHSYPGEGHCSVGVKDARCWIYLLDMKVRYIMITRDLID